MSTFHWGTLSAAALTVAGLLGAAYVMPTPEGTSVARAKFATPAAKAATQPGDGADLADMDTASGPVAQVRNYDLHAVIQHNAPVPRVKLVSLPGDLHVIHETDARKALFFKSVLPLVLQVNEQILKDRARLWKLRVQQQTGAKISAVDRLWLAVMADRYNVSRTDIAAMLKHHDVVPPSLALAQAATESAWGTSRFVRQGNAMFGQWTYSDDAKGIVPSQRGAGKPHRIKAFDSVYDSVQAYVENLNSHRAYKNFRTLRARMRAEGQTIDGAALAGTLLHYSERGSAYVSELRTIISANDLELLDDARLNPTTEPAKPMV